LAFSENLCDDSYRVQTFYYHCMPYQSGTPTYEERRRYARMDKYLTFVRRLDSFTVKLGRLMRKNDGIFQQKGVDVEFALDMTELSVAGTINKAIIVSGDSDFVPAVERATKVGVICCLVAEMCGLTLSVASFMQLCISLLRIREGRDDGFSLGYSLSQHPGQWLTLSSRPHPPLPGVDQDDSDPRRSLAQVEPVEGLDAFP